MPTHVVNGVRLYYELEGSGTPLVLLAGYGCDLGHWAAIRPVLAQHYHLLLVDNRGAGRSESPDQPASVDDMADDIAALIGELGLPRPHVLGHSLGAAIAQSLATRHPGLVDKLILSNPLLSLSPRTAAALRGLLHLREQGVPPALFIEGLLPWVFSPGFLAVSQNIQGAVTMTLANPHPQSLIGQSRHLEALQKFDSRPWFRAITRPALLIAGDEDICAPQSEAEELAAGIAGARLVVLRGMAHLPMLEAPEEFCRVVNEFCG